MCFTLKYSNSALARRGEIRQCCGWIAPNKRPPRLLEFIDPIGNAHSGILSLKSFCETNGLSYKKMSAVNSGSAVSHHGWTRGIIIGEDYPRNPSTIRRSSRKGQTKHNAKLTDESVAKSRLLFANGFPMKKIAEDNGVSVRTMRKAVDGTTWRHV